MFVFVHVSARWRQIFSTIAQHTSLCQPAVLEVWQGQLIVIQGLDTHAQVMAPYINVHLLVIWKGLAWSGDHDSAGGLTCFFFPFLFWEYLFIYL